MQAHGGIGWRHTCFARHDRSSMRCRDERTPTKAGEVSKRDTIATTRVMPTHGRDGFVLPTATTPQHVRFRMIRASKRYRNRRWQLTTKPLWRAPTRSTGGLPMSDAGQLPAPDTGRLPAPFAYDRIHPTTRDVNWILKSPPVGVGVTPGMRTGRLPVPTPDGAGPTSAASFGTAPAHGKHGRTPHET